MENLPDDSPSTETDFSAAASPKRPWCRFTVRTLLILMAVIGATLGPLAWRLERGRRLARDVVVMRAAGWQVRLDTPAPPGSRNGPATEHWRDFWWLRRLFGDAFFDDVVQVEVGQWRSPEGRRAVEALSRMTKVEKLWLGDPGSDELGNLNLPQCAFHERLTSLEIATDTVDVASLRRLLGAPNLLTVIVRAESGNVSALAELGHARRLRSITVWGTPPPDDVVAAWMDLKDLVQLDMDASAAAPETLARLMAGRRWNSVSLARCRSTAEVCRAITRRESLWTLEFDHSDFDDAALKAIAGSPALAELHAAGTPLTGSGFFEFGGFPALRQLHATGSAFDDQGALAISRLATLQRVTLGKTQVTVAGAAGLKRERPDLIVEGP